jgi:hypothetical protein
LYGLFIEHSIIIFVLVILVTVFRASFGVFIIFVIVLIFILVFVANLQTVVVFKLLERLDNGGEAGGFKALLDSLFPKPLAFRSI